MINSNFPIPNPDRRTINKISSTNSNNKHENINKNDNINNQSKNYNFNDNLQSSFEQHQHSLNISQSRNNKSLSESKEKEDFDKLNNMNLVKLKHIEDMRKQIMIFKLLNDKGMFLSNIPVNPSINKCNIILFGPSGSGKSSFIKSMYRSLYNTPILPPDAMNKLVIKNTYENEGTLCFTRLFLKEEQENSSGIIVCDTRGHIRMNEEEKEQFKVMIEGKVKDNVEIKQRVERNPLSLWEFWKKDSELFPKEIFKATEPGIESLPHSIVFVFDGSKDEAIEKEDECFYKELIRIIKRKGYLNVHVILTRIDLFEKYINENYMKIPSTERSTKVNTLKDEKIEKITEILGVNRSNVHFIENYHSENKKANSIEIDYQLLKTMNDIITSGELFIMNYLNKNETCFANCFGKK